MDINVYPETKDPSELKAYSFDWTPLLAEGDTIASILSTSFVDAAGTTNPQNTLASPITRTWLASGTHGGRVVWSVTIRTAGGEDLDAAFQVDVIDNATGPTAETTIERLTRQISEAETARHSLATGARVAEVMRDGRRMVYGPADMAALEDYIRALRSELVTAQTDAGVVPTRRRRAIGLGWRN